LEAENLLRLLVAEGNRAADRRRIVESAGATPGESYAKLLGMFAPEARIDICTPAEADAAIPSPLETYQGVVFTGSALNIYKREPESLRQVEFMRGLFARAVPTFGSCWGLQVAAVAAGGEVAPNPRGREVAFARKIALTDAGRRHPMHIGRAAVFDAPAIHGDEIVRLPENTLVTASNRMSDVQAAEIRCGAGVFWGVQYHPEYDFHDVATTLLRYGSKLVDEGFFRNPDELRRYAAELEILQSDPDRRDIVKRHELGPDLLNVAARACEISNWIDRQVRARAQDVYRAT
jgi:GMP synthase (glutamine-hydrolysing)